VVFQFLEDYQHDQCLSPEHEDASEASMTTAARLSRLVGILLIAGVAVANAAPNIPPNEMPGRERERFTPSPVDRFTDPLASQEPLWQWRCEPRKPRRSPKQRPKQQSRC
jgi:hypothetical protein